MHACLTQLSLVFSWLLLHLAAKTPFSSDKKVKEVKEVILRAKGNPDLASVADVNVLCGVLKDFLRKLRQPLLTFRMHKVFIDAAGEWMVATYVASTFHFIRTQ